MHQNLEKGKYASKDFIMLEINDFFKIIDCKKIVKSFDTK